MAGLIWGVIVVLFVLWGLWVRDSYRRRSHSCIHAHASLTVSGRTRRSGGICRTRARSGRRLSHSSAPDVARVRPLSTEGRTFRSNYGRAAAAACVFSVEESAMVFAELTEAQLSEKDIPAARVTARAASGSAWPTVSACCLSAFFTMVSP